MMKMNGKIIIFHLAVCTLIAQGILSVFIVADVKGGTLPGPWTQEKAWAWYNRQPWLVGCNFIPSTAVNQLEMWQADTFDPNTIDRELKWAADIGFNVIRVYLHDLLWEQDPADFLQRMDKFLAIADKHHIRVMFVLLDSCWCPFPKSSKQPLPRPHIHNSGWVQSPHIEILKDPSRYDELKGYIQGVIGKFKYDSRVLAWDLYNEPGNTNDAAYGEHEPKDIKAELALSLLKKVLPWVREVDPVQPVTIGVWKGEWKKDGPVNPLKQFSLENSDIITFHAYDDPDRVKERIREIKQYDRPAICTEYMSRGTGNTFQNILPLFKENRMGAINWGLVAGKTQTNYPWDSWWKKYDSEPDLWFHDILRPDGTPYCPEEVKFIKMCVK